MQPLLTFRIVPRVEGEQFLCIVGKTEDMNLVSEHHNQPVPLHADTNHRLSECEL